MFLEGKNCRKCSGKLNKNGLDYLQDSEGPASAPLSFYSATGVSSVASTVSSPLNPRLVNGLATLMSAQGGNTGNLENLVSWPNCQQQIQPPPHKQQILSTSTQVLRVLNNYSALVIKNYLLLKIQHIMYVKAFYKCFCLYIYVYFRF